MVSAVREWGLGWRQTRQGWSLMRLREQVLKVAATPAVHARQHYRSPGRRRRQMVAHLAEGAAETARAELTPRRRPPQHQK